MIAAQKRSLTRVLNPNQWGDRDKQGDYGGLSQQLPPQKECQMAHGNFARIQNIQNKVEG